MEAVAKLSAAGIASAPVQTAPEVVSDPHLAARNMLVEMERSDGVERPVLIPGNPVKLSKVAEGPESRIPWVGEHTRAVLTEELGLDDAAIDALVADGVVTD
jgi:crotonobetainyl-CoA:carnitine CoA-transferase CaiB-like acyl-CoA transferase